jgi:alanyl-tRNA synthetase
MQSSELRQKYLDFFYKKGHTIVPSASLIPEGDSTTLFITAGMQPLVPYLLGKSHPGGKRLVDVQKCVRTGDIDEVGDDTHLTFFEMLGNWSLGDYWKKESITWSFEFLTKELSIPMERLAVSCFAGDANAPKDEESSKIWKSLGIAEDRIAFLPKEDNWWGPVGETGPCGPDTEIFYWKSNDKPAPKTFDGTDKNWVEIWNNVFMQYVKDSNGNYVLAEQKNVDTGMGLERTVAILNGFENVYETDLFKSILELLPAAMEVKKKRVIADHSRAIVMLITDGVRPSNKDQGYILRRLMRRVISYQLFAKDDMKFTAVDVLEEVRKIYFEIYPTDWMVVHSEYMKELEKFTAGVKNGIQEYKKMRPLDAKSAFHLYQTFGLPFSVMKEMEASHGNMLKESEFNEEAKKHQELSQTASAGMFKGGLADHDPKTVKLHTAHHLLLAGLQELFGKQVKQRGSNINQERLRIDVSFDRKITTEEIRKLEDWVNDKIKQGLQVVKREMPLQEAEKIGAEMEFGVKYSNIVSVYFIEGKDGQGDLKGILWRAACQQYFRTGIF